VAARLHACIIAYSLKIPAIGVVWNDKLTFFGRNIGCEQYFVMPRELSVGKVKKLLGKALFSQYDPSIRERYRATIVNDIGETVSRLKGCNPI
jgi:polysaccharide pyruvyl transferase WcaK-like protein